MLMRGLLFEQVITTPHKIQDSPFPIAYKILSGHLNLTFPTQSLPKPSIRHVSARQAAIAVCRTFAGGKKYWPAWRSGQEVRTG